MNPLHSGRPELLHVQEPWLGKHRAEAPMEKSTNGGETSSPAPGFPKPGEMWKAQGRSTKEAAEVGADLCSPQSPCGETVTGSEAQGPAAAWLEWEVGLCSAGSSGPAGKLCCYGPPP